MDNANNKLSNCWDYIIDYVWLTIGVIGMIMNAFVAVIAAYYSTVMVVFSFIFLFLFTGILVWYVRYHARGYQKEKIELLKLKRIRMQKRHLFELLRILRLLIAIFFAFLLPGLFLLLVLGNIKITTFWIVFSLLLFILIITITLSYILDWFGETYWHWRRPKSIDYAPN
jgi:hypothetical protein